MDAETKKTVAGNGIVAAGLVAAAMTYSVMTGPEPQQTDPIDEQIIVERVASEVREVLADDAETMVLTPSKVHADVMIWLKQYEGNANEKATERDGNLMSAIETVAAKVAEVDAKANKPAEPNERLMTMLETLTTKVTELESKDNESSLIIDALTRQVNDGSRDAELTKVFETFDGRISRFEGAPARLVGGIQPTIIDTRSGSIDMRDMRLVADVAPAAPNAELNARLARMEAMLAGAKPTPVNAEGITVDWGDRVIARPTPAAVPANTGAVPKDNGKGIIRTTARATGETIEGGTDIATDTINNATNVAGQGVKDSVRTVSRFLGGASSIAGSTIGDTSSLAKKQGKSIWKKFW